MTVSFNRTRSRTIGVHRGQLNVELYDWRPCRVTRIIPSKATYYDQKSISDIVPVGSYQPGTFKLSNVLIQEVKYLMSPINGKVMQDNGTEGCPHSLLKGDYCTGFCFSPNPAQLVLGRASESTIRRLALRAYGKISATEIDLGETFAEFSSLLSMLRNPLSGLSNLILGCLFTKKGKRRPMLDASNAWLEVRYGWTPLISDLKKLWDEGVPKYDSDTIYNQSGKETFETLTPLPRTQRYLYGTVSIRCEGSIKTVNVDRVRLYFKVDDPALYGAVKRGTSIFNALPLAYQLVPLSFVLDWWSNLGDFISAIQPNPYVTVLGWTYSRKQEVTSSSWTTECFLDSLPQFAQNCVATFEERKRLYYREVRNDLLNQYLGPPRLDLDFRSLKHVVDSLSLIVQRVPRK